MSRPPERATFAAVAAAPRAARRFTQQILSEAKAPPRIVRDLALVASELFTNFVEHSDGAEVEVVVDLSDPSWWALEVNGGPGATSKRVPEPHTWTLAAAEQISGRGLGIVRGLMEEVVVDVGHHRVGVRCRTPRLA
jgi:anti-sigma regulatory factor (Ser/Thr protein kinase)